MNLYFDTSALVKFFHIEIGTENVTSLIKNKQNDIYISKLAKIEFYCALYRRLRNKEISRTNLDQAIEGFETQIHAFNIYPLSNTVVNKAENLIQSFGDKYGLRTLDALHLATFKLFSDTDWHFVTTDENLSVIAKAVKLKVMNPMKM